MPKFYKITVQGPKPMLRTDGSQITINGERMWSNTRQYYVEDEDGYDVMLKCSQNHTGDIVGPTKKGIICRYGREASLLPGKDYIPDYMLDEISQELAKIKEAE